VRGSLEFILDGVEATFSVCEDANPWVIFVCIQCHLDCCEFCSHDCVGFVLSGCIYVGGGVDGGVYYCSFITLVLLLLFGVGLF
jgi:hypothetical protein